MIALRFKGVVDKSLSGLSNERTLFNKRCSKQISNDWTYLQGRMEMGVRAVILYFFYINTYILKKIENIFILSSDKEI
jgi:hypothetical protein